MKKAARFPAFLLLLAFAAAFCPNCLPARALVPSYNVGPVYKKSAYYCRLAEIEPTGDNRCDLISVALSQLGYHEGDSELDMDGMNIRGSRNFVEFTRIYGRVDNREGNGTSYGYEWCAAFVSWCLRQAGVPDSAAVTEISCGRMTKWYKDEGAFFGSGSRTPLPGDIIMFSSDGKPGHVGLVLGVKDGDVYTIEGNNSGRVAIHCYALDDDYILGYCVPEYEKAEGADCTAFLEENCDRSGVYVVICDSLNLREKPDGGSRVVRRLKRGERVGVTDFSHDWGKAEVNGAEGWIAISGAIPEKDMVYTVTFDPDKSGGAKRFQRAFVGEALVIGAKTPKKAGYDFAGWGKKRRAKKADYLPGDEYGGGEDATLYALWEPKTYTVAFLDSDGSVISSEQYKYQDVIVLPPTPEKQSDGQYSYTFAGWDKKVADVVVQDLEYRATYTATSLPAREGSGDGLSGAPQEGESEAGAAAKTAVAIAAVVAAAVAAGAAAALVKRRGRSKKQADEM